MQTQTLIGKEFDQAIDAWIKELEKYNSNQILAKPSPAHWSLGQLYMHLIESTYFFIKQIKIAATNNDNENKEKRDDAKEMFRNNDLPDALLEGPPSNARTPQPETKEQLVTGLIQLKDEIKIAESLITSSHFKGKTKHFALDYFSAGEWLQFAEMHFRHHLRQKKRLDDFLKENNII